MEKCIDIQGQIMDYIDETLSEEDLKKFLEHIEVCPDCKNELNIYYTVYLGLKQLNHNDVEIEELKDVDSALEEQLYRSGHWIRKKRNFKIASYVFYTLVFWSIVTSLALQAHLLAAFGIF